MAFILVQNHRDTEFLMIYLEDVLKKQIYSKRKNIEDFYFLFFIISGYQINTDWEKRIR